MFITKEQILDAISNMSVIEINDLISIIENKFSISSKFEEKNIEKINEPIEEKTEFNFMLTNIGKNKIPVIKAVRNVTGLGLKEAKDLVESAPVLVKGGMNKNDADNLKKVLEDIGATVEIK